MKNTPTPCPICKCIDSQSVITTPVHMQKSAQLYSFHKCLNCGSIFLSDPPSAEEMSQYYNSDYLPYLGEKSWGKYKNFVKVSQTKLDQKRVKTVLKIDKKIGENYNILDFGCGNPTFLNQLKRKTNANCIGFDINPNGWENRKDDYKEIELIYGDLNKISFPHKFNLITLWHTLEHEFHPVELILFFNKITTNHATLIVEVPNYHSFTRWAQKKYWGGYHTPRHSVVYTPETLKIMMEKLGWNKIGRAHV